MAIVDLNLNVARHIYYPEITFEDTNLVGNVYFASFVRWQNACRNEWLRETNLRVFEEIFRGQKRLGVSELAMKFHDSNGITVGDSAEIDMSVMPLGEGLHQATFTIRRSGAKDSKPDLPIVATGHQRFAVVDCASECPIAANDFESPVGRAFVVEFPIPIDACYLNGRIDDLHLIRWQGKCRERFLAEHAPGTLLSVVSGYVALHTSQLSFQVMRQIRIAPTDRLRLEMRLTQLKGGRLAVEFDYYVIAGLDYSRTRQLIAIGAQSLCCKRPSGSGSTPTVFPADMLQALREFTESKLLHSNIDEALEFINVNIDSNDSIRANKRFLRTSPWSVGEAAGTPIRAKE